MRRPSRLLVTVPLLVAVAAVQAGCGGASSTRASGGAAAPPSPSALPTVSPVLRLQAASESTSKAGSARFALESHSQVAGKTVTETVDGVQDPARRLAQMTVRLGLGGQQTSIEERVVGDALYIGVPQSPGTFYQVSVSQLVGTSLANSTDPTAGLQALRAASNDTTVVGQDQVRGAVTTHYRGTYDAKAALAKVDGAAKQLFQQALQGGNTTAVPYDAWIDQQGRLVKMQQHITATVKGQSVVSDSTVELFDFGTAVAVSAPPAAQVKDGAPLLKALRGSGS